MLTDDSAGKQAAIKKAFQGLEDGEQDVNILLCIEHSDRTLKRHFGHPTKVNILRHLREALWGSFTKKEREDAVQAAINTAKDNKEAKYIKKEWFNSIELWASYPYQHSSLLLQIRTTSPLEAWHGALKRNLKQAWVIRAFRE
jgi:hypothetical protein